MNPLRVIDSIKGALKHLALAGPMLTAASLGSAPSAHAQLPVTSGLVLRMDASQITGTADGAQLDTWTDTSGAANNAVRQSGSSAGYPMYVASGINGQPVVRFNSANGNTGDYFRFNRISTIRSVFWVIKGTQANGTHFLLGDDNSYQFHRGNGGNAGKLWDATYAADNIKNGTTKLMGGSINGTTTSLPSGSFQLVSLVTTGSVQANQICQDRSYNGSWQGDIAEILIYNRALSGPEENQVGYYLGTKYGLTTTYTAPQSPPSDALIHYDFDSVSGTTVTNTGSLGSAADGTLANASLVTGQFNNALSFTGSSSGVITQNNVAIGNAFTLACWVSTTNANANYRRIILNNYQQSGYLGTDGGGNYLTILKDQFAFTSTPPDTSGAWHHLAMTWDGTTQKFYYDGTLNTSNTQSQNTTFTEKFGFGCNLGFGESWNGKMDDAFVFGRALSVAEIGSLYLNIAATLPAVPTGVAATPASSGTVNVSWSADANATSRTVSVTNTTTSVEQHFTTAGATSYSVTGLTNGTSYEFKVSATNGIGTSAYSSIVTATPAVGTAKNILTFVFPGQLNATISGTNISVILPVGATVTSLAPTYTVSSLATGSPASGTTRDFTSPQTYTITAEDSSSQVYTVTVKTDSRPPVTDGLIVWLAADRVNPADTNQVRIAGADTFVKLWNDGSGNSKNATQAVNGDQPKYIASGAGGKPVLRFTQTNDDAGSQMELGDISSSFPSAGSMFAVSTINTDGRYNLFDNRNNDSRWVANTYNESVPGVFRDNRQGMTYSAWPQTGSHVFAMESGSGVYRFLNDGAVIGSNAGGNFHSGSGQNWIIGDRPGNSQQLNGDIPEFLLYNRILTAAESNAVGAYLAAKYAVTTTYPALPAPTVPTGVAVSGINATSMSVSWTAASNAESYNVSVKNTATNAVQVFAAGVSPHTVTGLTGGTSYEFTVQSVNSTGASAYSAPPVTGVPGVSSAKDILTFVFPGQLDAVISGTNISLTVPTGTDVATLAPTFTVSSGATSSPASGTARNFSSAQTYTITAEDTSFQVYTVTVTAGAVPNVFTWASAVAGNWSESAKWTNNLATITKPIDAGQADYTLNFTQAGTYTTTQNLNHGFLLNQLNFGGAVTLAGTNSLALSSNGATLPTLNQNSGSAVVISTPLNLAANTTLGGSGNGQLSLNGIITGAGSLTKTNSGTLTLSAVNDYTGGTSVTAGTLNPHGNGSAAARAYFGAGTVTMAGGTTLHATDIAGQLVIFSNAIALSGGTVNVFMPFGGAADLRLTGIISGSGGFSISGGSRGLRLAGNNTFSGGVTINDGNRVEVDHVNALGTGALNINHASSYAALNYSGTHTVTSLTVVGVVKTAPGTYGSTASGATFTDNAHFQGTGTVTVGTLYDIWANGTFANAFTDKAPTSNPDGDGLTNLQEYAFGTDPTVSSAGPITYADNVLTGYGPPEVSNFAGGPNGVDYRMVFCRRKNPASLGLTYTAEFSVDFTTWSPNAVTPTLLGTDAAGVMEVVSVPYPFFIITARGVEKPTFSHVKVESN